jgi:RND family efflux transporter MFP subunit
MQPQKTLALATLIAASACRHDVAVEEPATAVETVAVEPLRHEAGVRYSANVQAAIQVSLAFRATGYVRRLYFDEGDVVRKGTVLAEIRTADARERLAQATAGQAEANASLFQAKEDYRRAVALYEAKSMTKPELDAAEARYAAAKAKVFSATAVVGEGKIGLADTKLVAPFDGVVLARNVEVGDLAGPSAPAFVVADTSNVKVELDVPDVMVGALAIGQVLDVTTESRPGTVYPARVSRIAPAADARSRAFPVELEIDNSKGELKPGMVASLEIGRGNPSSVIVIPLAAVARPPRATEGYAVFVVDGGAAHAREVSLGNPVGNSVIVERGVAAGE